MHVPPHPSQILRISVRKKDKTTTGGINWRDWQNGVIDDINYNDDDYDDDGFDYKTCGLALRRMHINEKRSSGFSSPASALLVRFQNDEWRRCDKGTVRVVC